MSEYISKGRRLDSIIYGLRRVVLVPGRGARVTPMAEHEPSPWIRARHGSPQPGSDADLPGRDRDVEEALSAVRGGRRLEFHAPHGTGVSSLLMQVARRLDDEDMTAVVLRVGRDTAEDLQQRVFARLYATSEPLRPTPEQCQVLLDQAQPVLLLDDVRISAAELERLLEALPDGAAVVGAGRSLLPARLGRSRRLDGVTGETALRVIRRAQGRSLTSEERETARRLVDAVGGRPLHLQHLAALARREGRSFDELEQTVAEADGAAADAIDRLRLEALGQPERLILAALVRSDGWPLPAAAVAAMTGVAAAAGHLELLHRDRLVAVDGQMFAVASPDAAVFQEVGGLLDVGTAAHGLAGWLEREPPAGETARASAAAAAQVLTLAAEHGEWPAVLRLTGPVEAALMLSGRWASWRRVLEQGLAAARTTGDRAAEAHCCHQLGVLAYCHDDHERSRGLLERALALRADLGDHGGVSVTVDNLRLLPPPLTVTLNPPQEPGGELESRSLTPSAPQGRPERPKRPRKLRRERPAAFRPPKLRAPAIRRPAIRRPGFRMPAFRWPAFRTPTFRRPAARPSTPTGRLAGRRWMVLALLLVATLAVPVAIGSVLALERSDSGEPTPEAGASSSSAAPTTTTLAGPPPGWSADPATLEFAALSPGFVSDSQVVSVRSSGGGPIGSIDVTGDASAFRVSRECTGAVVPAGSRCRIQVQFAPTSPGAKQATVVVGFETDDRVVQARLTGQAQAG